jgi:hypothetical protein
VKQNKFISILSVLCLIISLSPSNLPPSAKAEEKNPLTIEKIIGLSAEPSTFRSISSSGWDVNASDKQGLAIASDGTIYIGDTAEAQVDIFSKELKYLKSFGSLGSGEGQFQQITSITIDHKEQIYVLDGYLATVQVFKKDGTFIRKWGEKGHLPNQLMTPIDLCFLESGEILLADYTQGLKVFSEEGEFIRDFTTHKLISPLEDKTIEGMEYDENAYLYVHIYDQEKYEATIHKFDEKGTYIGKAVDIDPEEGSYYVRFANMAIAGQYFFITCYSNHDTIRRYKIPANPKEKLSYIDDMVKTTEEDLDNPRNSDFFSISSCEVKNGILYYLDGFFNRLTLMSLDKEYLGTIKSSIMSSRVMYERMEKKPFPLGYLRNPQGVRIDNHQRIFVANAAYSCVSIFDLDGSPIANVGEVQKVYDKVGPGELHGPTDIAFDENENFFVTAIHSDSVQVFDKNFSPISTIQQSFASPQGIVFDADDRLLLINSGSDSLSILENNSTKLKYKTSKKIRIKGDWPVGVDVDKDNNILISSTNTGEIHLKDPDGKTFKIIGEEGKNPGQLSGPQGVMVDANNDIYVVETENGRVQKFSSDGTLIWCSELNWMGLSFISQDTEGLLYLTDCIHGLVLVVRDATAVKPKPKVKKDLPPSGDFSISNKTKESLKPGEIITLQVKVDDLTKVESVELSFLYPNQNLTYKATRIGTELKEKKFQLHPIVISEQKIEITSRSLGGANYELSGILFEVDFEVKASGTALLKLDGIILKNASGKEFQPKSTQELTIKIE